MDSMAGNIAVPMVGEFAISQDCSFYYGGGGGVNTPTHVELK